MAGTRKRKQTGNQLLLKRAVSRMGRSKTPIWGSAIGIGGSTLYDVNEPRAGITVLPSIARDSHLVHIMQSSFSNNSRTIKNNRSRRTTRVLPNKTIDKPITEIPPKLEKTSNQSWRKLKLSVNLSGHSLKRNDRSRASSSGYPSSWNLDTAHKESSGDAYVPNEIINNDLLNYQKSKIQKIDNSVQCALKSSRKKRCQIQEPLVNVAQTQTMPSKKSKSKKTQSNSIQDIKNKSTIVQMDKILVGLRKYQQTTHNSWHSECPSSELLSAQRQRVYSGGDELQSQSEQNSSNCCICKKVTSTKSSRCNKQTCLYKSKHAKNYGGYSPSETSYELNGEKVESSEYLDPSESPQRLQRIEKISLPPNSNNRVVKSNKNRNKNRLNDEDNELEDNEFVCKNVKTANSEGSWRLRLATENELKSYKQAEDYNVCAEVCQANKAANNFEEGRTSGETSRKSRRDYQQDLYNDKRNADFRHKRKSRAADEGLNGKSARNNSPRTAEESDEESCDCDCSSCNREKNGKNSRKQPCKNCSCAVCLRLKKQDIKSSRNDFTTLLNGDKSSKRNSYSRNQSETEESDDCDCSESESDNPKESSRKKQIESSSSEEYIYEGNVRDLKDQSDLENSCDCDCPGCEKICKTNTRKIRRETNSVCKCSCEVCEKLRNSNSRADKMIRKSFSADNSQNTSRKSLKTNENNAQNYASCYCNCAHCPRSPKNIRTPNQNYQNFKGCQCQCPACPKIANQRDFTMKTKENKAKIGNKSERPVLDSSKKANSAVQFKCKCSKNPQNNSKSKNLMCSDEKCVLQCDICQFSKDNGNSSGYSSSASDSDGDFRNYSAKPKNSRPVSNSNSYKKLAIKTRNKEVQCSCKCPHCGINLDELPEEVETRKSPIKPQTSNANQKQSLARRNSASNKELPNRNSSISRSPKEEPKTKTINAREESRKSLTTRKEPKTKVENFQNNSKTKDNNSREETRNKSINSRAESRTKSISYKKEPITRVENFKNSARSRDNISGDDSQTNIKKSSEDLRNNYESSREEPRNRTVSSRKEPKPKVEKESRTKSDISEYNSRTKFDNSREESRNKSESFRKEPRNKSVSSKQAPKSSAENYRLDSRIEEEFSEDEELMIKCRKCRRESRNKKEPKSSVENFRNKSRHKYDLSENNSRSNFENSREEPRNRTANSRKEPKSSGENFRNESRTKNGISGYESRAKFQNSREDLRNKYASSREETRNRTVNSRKEPKSSAENFRNDSRTKNDLSDNDSPTKFESSREELRNKYDSQLKIEIFRNKSSSKIYISATDLGTKADNSREELETEEKSENLQNEPISRNASRAKLENSSEEPKSKTKNGKKGAKTKGENVQKNGQLSPKRKFSVSGAASGNTVGNGRRKSKTKTATSREESKVKVQNSQTKNAKTPENSKTIVKSQKKETKSSTESSPETSRIKTESSKENLPQKTELSNSCTNETCTRINCAEFTLNQAKTAMANMVMDEQCNVNQILEILHSTVAGLEQQKKLLSQAVNQKEINEDTNKNLYGYGNNGNEHMVGFTQKSAMENRCANRCVNKSCYPVTCYRQCPRRSAQCNQNYSYNPCNQRENPFVNCCRNAEKVNEETNYDYVELTEEINNENDNNYCPCEPEKTKNYYCNQVCCPVRTNLNTANNPCCWLKPSGQRKCSGSAYPTEGNPKSCTSFSYSEIKRRTLQNFKPTKSFFNLFDMALIMKKNRKLLRNKNTKNMPQNFCKQRQLLKSREHCEYLENTNPKYLDIPKEPNSYERNILRGLKNHKTCVEFKSKRSGKTAAESLHCKCPVETEECGRRQANYRKSKATDRHREQSEQTELTGKHSKLSVDSSVCGLCFCTELKQKKAKQFDCVCPKEFYKELKRKVEKPRRTDSSESRLVNRKSHNLNKKAMQLQKQSSRKNYDCKCTSSENSIESNLPEEFKLRFYSSKDDARIQQTNKRDSYKIYNYKEAETPKDIKLKTFKDSEDSKNRSSSALFSCCRKKVKKSTSKTSDSKFMEEPEEIEKFEKPKKDSHNLFPCFKRSVTIKEEEPKVKSSNDLEKKQPPKKKSSTLFPCFNKANREKKQQPEKLVPKAVEEPEQKQKPKRKCSNIFPCFNKTHKEKPEKPKDPEKDEKPKKKSSTIFPCFKKSKKAEVKKPEKKSSEDFEQTPKQKSNLFACCNRPYKEKKEKPKESAEELEKDKEKKPKSNLFSCCKRTSKKRLKETDKEKKEPAAKSSEEQKNKQKSNLFSCCKRTDKEKKEKLKEPEPKSSEKDQKIKQKSSLFSCCERTPKEKKEPAPKSSEKLEKPQKPNQKSPSCLSCYNRNREKKAKPAEAESKISQDLKKSGDKSTSCFSCLRKDRMEKIATVVYKESSLQLVNSTDCCLCDDERMEKKATVVYKESSLQLDNSADCCLCDDDRMEKKATVVYKESSLQLDNSADCCLCDDDDDDEVKILYDSSYKFFQKNNEDNNTDCECDCNENLSSPKESSNNFYSMIQKK